MNAWLPRVQLVSRPHEGRPYAPIGHPAEHLGCDCDGSLCVLIDGLTEDMVLLVPNDERGA